ncbi:MAG: hypothetical protein AB8G95_30010 [Anaerolineae bacterium]
MTPKFKLQPLSDWFIGLPFLIPFLGMVLISFDSGTLRAGTTPFTIAFFLISFASFILVLVFSERRPNLIRWEVMWGVAIVARLLLLFTIPSLSDDVYRYLWDGHVANSGVSPYALPIESAELDYLEIPVRALANNTWMASPYMPTAQWIFRGLNWIAPVSPLSMQITMVVFELGAAFFAAKLLAAAGYPSNRLLLILWNPLFIVEVAHSAHIDAWMILLMLSGIWFAIPLVPAKGAGNASRETGQITTSSLRLLLSPILIAFATLTKILPVLILPVLFWYWNWRQRFMYGILSVGLLIPAGLRAGWGLVGPLDGTGLFGALRIYNDRWKFNSGLFFWVTRWLNDGDGYSPSPADGQVKLVVLLIMLIVLLVVWYFAYLAYQRQDVRSSIRLMTLPLMAYLLLTHTVHPWYALILLIFLPFLAPAQDENKYYWLITAPWIYLSGGLIFSYLTYLNPDDFRELARVRNLEWIPTLVLLAIGFAAWLTVLRIKNDETIR